MMLLILSLFLAVGISSARLTCDGEAIEVESYTTTWGDVQLVVAICDSLGPWRDGEWVSAGECEVTREEVK